MIQKSKCIVLRLIIDNIEGVLAQNNWPLHKFRLQFINSQSYQKKALLKEVVRFVTSECTLFEMHSHLVIVVILWLDCMKV